MLFLEQFLVDAGDALVGQLEDVFYGGREHGTSLLLGVKRGLDFEQLLVLAVELDVLRRLGGLE